MQDYKLKVILTVLSAIVFSMIFILLALVVPAKEEPGEIKTTKHAKSTLEKISKGIQK